MITISLDNFNIICNTEYKELIHVRDFLMQKYNINFSELKFGKYKLETFLKIENKNEFIVYRYSLTSDIIFSIFYCNFEEFKRLIKLKEFL
jgi:hypothetical protein